MAKRRRAKKAVCCSFKDVNFIDRRLLKDYTSLQIIRDLDNEYPGHGLQTKHIVYHREKHFKPKLTREHDAIPMKYALKNYSDISNELNDPMVTVHHSVDMIYNHALKLDAECKKYGYLDPALLKFLKASIDGAARLIELRLRLAQQSVLHNPRVDQKILAFVENRFDAGQGQGASAVTDSLAMQVKNEQLAKRGTSMNKVFGKLENPSEEVLFGGNKSLTPEAVLVQEDGGAESFNIEDLRSEAEYARARGGKKKRRK